MMKAIIYLLFSAAILSLSDGTLSQSDKKAKKDAKKKSTSDLVSGPVAMSVYMKGLVSTKISTRWFFCYFLTCLQFTDFCSKNIFY